MDRDGALRQLDSLADDLAREGKRELAERARAAIAALRNGSASHDHPTQGIENFGSSDPDQRDDILSLDEAAALLGVRSLPMIRRWAHEGMLDQVTVRGTVHITRGSIERLLQTEVVSWQRERERELDEILEAFDVGDEELPPSESSSIGRKPWDSVGTRQP